MFVDDYCINVHVTKKTGSKCSYIGNTICFAIYQQDESSLKENKTNKNLLKRMRQKLMETESKVVVIKAQGVRSEVKSEMLVRRYKLPIKFQGSIVQHDDHN